MITKSAEILKEAEKIIPGGVNSPVRAFKSVGGAPRVIAKGSGAHITDVDGNEYIDYVCSWGSLLLGHAHPIVIQAVGNAIQNGLGFGAPCQDELKLAKKIQEALPHMEMLRMVNSGTEATLSALRLARGYTSKRKIIKFDGNYHGHSDSLLVKAGSGLLTFGSPSSGGVLEDIAKHTLVAEFNNIESVKQLFIEHKNDIACIILEPVAGNMNLVPGTQDFIEQLRILCDENQTLLIFDEVMTGFRVAFGGCTEIYNIIPDLVCLGKIIGGGLPVGAFGGKREIMQHLSPLGSVYQAGTLSGNPISMAAGLANLEYISNNKETIYQQVNNHTIRLGTTLKELANSFGIKLLFKNVGGMFGFYFLNDNQHDILSLQDVQKTKIHCFITFFHEMLNAGVYLPPSAYEACFLSICHNEDTFNKTIRAAEIAFQKINHDSIY